MAVYEKWQSEIYSIGCDVWVARCPNCHYRVESSEHISSNYRFCPYCGYDMKSTGEDKISKNPTKWKWSLVGNKFYCRFCGHQIELPEMDYKLFPNYCGCCGEDMRIPIE